MNNLKHLRSSLRITQLELAQSIGMTQGAVAHYESGRRTPGLSDCRNIVRALNRLGVKCSLGEVFPDRPANHDKTIPLTDQAEQGVEPSVYPSSIKQAAHAPI